MTAAASPIVMDQTEFCEVHVSYGTESRTIRAAFGQRLMQTIRDAGLPIAGDCGGACTCATCHVYVDEDWLDRLSPPTANEAALLEVVDEPSPFSRLSCQIELTRETDGIRIRIAPGS
jgi:2Fe-2S ferredoxin